MDPQLMVDLNEAGEIVLECSCGWHSTMASVPGSAWDEHFHAAHPVA